MAYKALKNTVSVSMNKQGKIKYGAQVGYNKHNNDPQARQEHNKNVNPDLTQYNFNLIYLDGQLDTSDMSDYDKFNRAFSHRANQRKKKDTMGRDIKIEGTNIARETIWYPPENLFDDCTTPQERAEKLRQFADDLLPFLQDTFGKANIVELSGHLDECKIYVGRPHLQLLTTNIICEGQEWQEVRKSRKKGATSDDKEVIQHSVGDVFGDTWFGGKAKCKRIKERYRRHLINCGYDVKFEDMTEEERLSTGVLYTSETDERSFQAHLDAKQDVTDRETAVTAREIAADETEAAQKKRKSELDEQETAIQADRDDLIQREAKYQADLQTLVTGQQALREKQKKQEQAEKDFQAREDKLEAQKRLQDERETQLYASVEPVKTNLFGGVKNAADIINAQQEQITVLQARSDRKTIYDSDLQAASKARSDAERHSAEAAADRQTAATELESVNKTKQNISKIIQKKVKEGVEAADKREGDKGFVYDQMQAFINASDKRKHNFDVWMTRARQERDKRIAQDVARMTSDIDFSVSDWDFGK